MLIKTISRLQLFAAPCDELPDGEPKGYLHQGHIEGNDEPCCAVDEGHRAVAHPVKSSQTDIENCFGDQQPDKGNR